MVLNTTLAHVCPVCGGRHIKADWESTDENHNWWWTGHYSCLSCLTIYRASGSIRMDEPVVHAWHPACRQHGTDAVVISEQDNQHFYCVKCGRRMEVQDGRIIDTWQPLERTIARPDTKYDHVFWGVTNRKSSAYEERFSGR